LRSLRACTRFTRHFAATCCLLIIATVLALSQNKLAESSSPPFRIGEHLIYAIKWDPPWYLFFLPSMEAGEVDLQIVEETEYRNKKAIKIVLKVRSSGSLAKLTGMKVDDELVFFSEPATFCTLAVSEKIREGKRKRQIQIEYFRETRRLHFREIDENVVPPYLRRDVVKSDIPPCVQDPFSALYSYRMSALREGHTQTLMLGDNEKIKEVRCRVEKQEAAEVPAGKFLTWKINTEAMMGGLFKEGGQFRIWLTADERKIPIQFEVRVRLGKVLGRLKSQP
jgi:hypothetical protein